MASIETKNMDRPDETRTPEKTSVSVVHLGDATVGRFTLQPGWKWSDCIKPVVGGDSCQAAHLGYVVSGNIHIAATDGAEADLSAGDAYRLEPGHDAWVVGAASLVALEFESKTAEPYAKGCRDVRGPLTAGSRVRNRTAAEDAWTHPLQLSPRGWGTPI